MKPMDRLCVPQYIADALFVIGMHGWEPDCPPFWQLATDFLRERYQIHITIPLQAEAAEVVFEETSDISSEEDRYTFEIWSSYGEDFEDDNYFTDYYKAMEAGLVAAINGIHESRGWEKIQKKEILTFDPDQNN